MLCTTSGLPTCSNRLRNDVIEPGTVWIVTTLDASSLPSRLRPLVCDPKPKPSRSPPLAICTAAAVVCGLLTYSVWPDRFTPSVPDGHGPPSSNTRTPFCMSAPSPYQLCELCHWIAPYGPP